MKLHTYEQEAAPGTAALSVSLKGIENETPKPVRNPKKEEADLWQEISEELARDASPVWRMWR